jgi:hypothetical protein
MSEKPTREQFQAKIDRAHAVRIKAEQFFNAGEDMNFKEALLIGIELSLAGEFGYPAPEKPR